MFGAKGRERCRVNPTAPASDACVMSQYALFPPPESAPYNERP
jgi:hypothetical protein